MNKNIYYLMVAALLVGFSSCDEEAVDKSSITGVPMELASLTEQSNVMEVEATHTINFEFDDGQIVGTTVDISVDPSSTATEGVDFTLASHSVTVDPYVKTGSFTYTILEDEDPNEGSEIINFVLSREDHSAFGIGTPRTAAVTIQDSINTDLFLTMEWNGTFEYLGTTYPICGNVDLDFLVYTAAGEYQGYFGAGTGDCPEHMTLSGLEDGDYLLAMQMYENGLDGLSLDVPYPVTTTAYKWGAINETFVSSVMFTSEDEDYINDGNEGATVFAQFTVAGDTYSISNEDGTFVGEGLKAPGRQTK